MKKAFFYFVVLMSFSLTTQTQTREKRRFDGTTSLIELIANGEKYDLQKVLIKGYFIDLERRGRLFLHKDDALYDILGNSIIIEYNSVEDLNLLRSWIINIYLSKGHFILGLADRK
jgi:hypothetical protein